MLQRLAVRLVLSLAAMLSSAPARAGTVQLAVAANFSVVAEEIATAFAAATGHKASQSSGATGQLYTQITQGAPFDVLLAADDERPKLAVAAGLGVEESRFTYAIGRLVLWSRTLDVTDGPAALKSGNFAKLAIANPAVAPYGTAAVETLKSLGLSDLLASKRVQGNSIAQTFQFVDTGNAELGFVARSQLTDATAGTRWLVPTALHAAIRQDAVLLVRAADNDAAKAYMAFLKGPEARAIIARHGYDSAGPQ